MVTVSKTFNVFLVIAFTIQTIPEDNSTGQAVYETGAIVFLLIYALIISEVLRDELTIAWLWLRVQLVRLMAPFELPEDGVLDGSSRDTTEYSLLGDEGNSNAPDRSASGPGVSRL